MYLARYYCALHVSLVPAGVHPVGFFFLQVMETLVTTSLLEELLSIHCKKDSNT